MNNRRQFVEKVISTAALSLIIPLTAKGKEAVTSAGFPMDDRGKSKQKHPRMMQFNEWKYGLFIHWGPFAQAAPSNGRIGSMVKKIEQGLNWYKTFNPVKFDPKQWAKLAKDNGMRYAVLVSKHHDGFCNWDSKVTDFCITNPDCPWSKTKNPDIVKEYLKAFQAEGLATGLYFSHLNWSLPEGANVKRHPKDDETFNEKNPDKWKKYVEISRNQVRELITKYDNIDIIWFDIHYPDGYGQDATPMLEMIRELQKDIIIDNRGTGDFKDFLVQEQFIPIKPPFDYWELNIPIAKGGGFWFQGEEAKYRDGSELIPAFADIVHKGGNFLLNIGPKGDGSIAEQEQEAIRTIGKWMKDNSEAVYGSYSSPWGEAPEWGRITRKGQKIYLLLFNWKPGTKINLGLAKDKIQKAYVLKTGTKANYSSSGTGVEITVPDEPAPSEYVYVIAVEFKGDLEVEAKWPPGKAKQKKIHHFDKDKKDMAKPDKKKRKKK